MFVWNNWTNLILQCSFNVNTDAFEKFFFIELSLFWTLVVLVQTYRRRHFISLYRWCNLFRSVWIWGMSTPVGPFLTGTVWRYCIYQPRMYHTQMFIATSWMVLFQVKKALRGVRVETTHQEGKRSAYKITGITSAPLIQLKYIVPPLLPSPVLPFFPSSAKWFTGVCCFSFPLDEGNQMTVVQYFWDRYKYRLRFTSWPCLQSGNDSRPIYLPMEVIFSYFVHDTWCGSLLMIYNMIAGMHNYWRAEVRQEA